MYKEFLTLLVILSLIPMVYPAITGVSVNVGADDIFGSSTKKVWIINWNARDSDKLHGTLYDSDLTKTAKEYVDENAKVEQDFEITMSSGDEKAEYMTTSYLASPIFLIRLEKYEKWCYAWDDSCKAERDSWANSHCHNAYVKYNVITMIGYTAKAWCAVRGQTIAQPMRIGSPKTIFQTTFCVDGDDISKECKTLSNDNNAKSGSTTRFGNLALIKWQGSLSTQVYPPRSGDQGVIAVHGNSIGWRITDESKYETWKAQVGDATRNSALYDCVWDWANGKTTKESCEQEYNKFAWDAVSKTRDQYFEEATINSEGDKARISLDLKEGLHIPSFVMYVNSDKLKIIIPKGIPYVVKTWQEPKNLDEVSMGYIKTIVKNIGKERGSFDVRIKDCPSGYYVSNEQHVDLDGGESKTLTFEVSGKGGTSGSCTVYMKETTTQKQVSKKVTVNVVEHPECEPGKWYKYVGEGGVQCYHQCKADAVSYQNAKCCKLNEEAVLQRDGTYKCKEKGNGNGNGNGGEECRWWDIPCMIGKAVENLMERLGEFFEPLIIGVSILISIIVGILTTDLFRKRDILQKKDDKIYRWLAIALIVAIFGFITYTYFWLGILLFILYYIAKKYIVPVAKGYAKRRFGL